MLVLLTHLGRGRGVEFSVCVHYAWYVHVYYTHQELRDGRNRLKREVRKSENAPVKFMQDNLDAFLLCYQTLSDILYIYNTHIHTMYTAVSMTHSPA